MIMKPTVGRVVLYHPRPSNRVKKLLDKTNVVAAAGDHVVHAAIVAHVYSDHTVNLTAFDSQGTPYGAEDVTFIHDEATPKPEFGGWCEWMSYQKAVAQGTISPTLHAQPGASS